MRGTIATAVTVMEMIVPVEDENRSGSGTVRTAWTAAPARKATTAPSRTSLP